MIRFYFHSTPNAAKVALFLEEADLPYEVVPVDTHKGEQHTAAFRIINPNGKVPAIIDTEGPAGKETRVFDSTAILIYLAEKTNRFLGVPENVATSWPGSHVTPPSQTVRVERRRSSGSSGFGHWPRGMPHPSFQSDQGD